MAPGLSDTDLYEVLGVLPDASISEIKTAYRKKALKCHPDKNPDNPKAAKEWEELSNALEVLTDKEARAAYDKVLKAKKANELRNRALESKRRKVKEDLEAREAAFREEQERERGQVAAQQLQSVIKKLQEEGSRILAEEQRLLKEELKKGGGPAQQEDEPPRLKIKWKSKKTDESNGGYSHDVLHRILQKYGPVTNLLISSKRKGSAVVEFESARAAELAVRNEMGLSSNPLELSWLSGRPEASSSSVLSSVQQSSSASETDFESLVLQKLKTAEQQKRSSQQHTSTEEDTNAARSNFQDGFRNDTSKFISQGSRTQDESSKLCPEDSSPHAAETERGLSPDECKHAEEKSDQNSGSFAASSGGVEARDYESVVLMRMRQAAERQRLIEQMAKEDAKES